MRSRWTRSRPIVLLAFVASAILAFTVLGWIGASELLTLLPALLIGCLLLARRYPGERVLIAHHGRNRSRRAERPPKLSRLGHQVVLLSARGGLLIARSLAVRPPPLLAAS